jgi:hypothetical protein
MSLPLYDSGFWPALALGVVFGLALEGAGFGSARKLTAQFTLRDFSVFKVMFTAVIVAATGLWLAETVGLMAPRSVFIPTLYAWGIAVGGISIGTGFALGGYCPGTSAVGLASGRVDALVFIVGMVAGVAVFAWGFDALSALYLGAAGPKGQTLDQLLGVPVPVILIAMTVMAIGGFWLGSRLERRFGGPVTATEVTCASEGAHSPTSGARHKTLRPT